MEMIKYLFENYFKEGKDILSYKVFNLIIIKKV